MLPLLLILAATLLLSLLAHCWLYMRVWHPLNTLTAQADRLSTGEFTAFVHTSGGITQIEALRRAMQGMVSHVRRAQQQHRVYHNSLSEGQEAERARLARELHDETVQSLIAIAQSIDLAQTWVKGDPDRAGSMLKLARDQTVQSVEVLRNLIADLRPPALDELGLVAALKMQAERTCPTQVNISVKGTERRIDPGIALGLFRITQEALTNAHRHSGSAQIHVDVSFRRDGIQLHIDDDGEGFELPADLNDLALERHYGLLGMQERTAALNGLLQIRSERGKGTKILVTIPEKEQLQPAETVRDPVCSALLQPDQAYSNLIYEGRRYYFCCPVCEGAFQRDPAVYLRDHPATPE